MYEHLTKSKEAKEFFKDANIKISKKSAHNTITLIAANGKKLTLWAESDSGIAAGIPGIYIDEK